MTPQSWCQFNQQIGQLDYNYKNNLCQHDFPLNYTIKDNNIQINQQSNNKVHDFLKNIYLQRRYKIYRQNTTLYSTKNNTQHSNFNSIQSFKNFKFKDIIQQNNFIQKQLRKTSMPSIIIQNTVSHFNQKRQNKHQNKYKYKKNFNEKQQLQINQFNQINENLSINQSNKNITIYEFKKNLKRNNRASVDQIIQKAKKNILQFAHQSQNSNISIFSDRFCRKKHENIKTQANQFTYQQKMKNGKSRNLQMQNVSIYPDISKYKIYSQLKSKQKKGVVMNNYQQRKKIQSNKKQHLNILINRNKQKQRLNWRNIYKSGKVKDNLKFKNIKQSEQYNKIRNNSNIKNKYQVAKRYQKINNIFYQIMKDNKKQKYLLKKIR